MALYIDVSSRLLYLAKGRGLLGGCYIKVFLPRIVERSKISCIFAEASKDLNPRRATLNSDFHLDSAPRRSNRTRRVNRGRGRGQGQRMLSLLAPIPPRSS